MMFSGEENAEGDCWVRIFNSRLPRLNASDIRSMAEEGPLGQEWTVLKGLLGGYYDDGIYC
jgi:hypothetical protein